MPAYNAEKTLKQTYDEIYKDFVDEVILVDDNSQDNTKIVSKQLNITTIVHKENKGYGGNQKSCYKAALKAGADIVVMLHPDYQYTPKLIPAIVSMMAFGQYDAVMASRMLGNSALKGGMPFYKFVANKFLTAFDKLKPAKFGRKFAKVQYFGIDENSDKILDDMVHVMFYNSSKDFAVMIDTEGADKLYLYRTNDNKAFDRLYSDMFMKRTQYEGERIESA